MSGAKNEPSSMWTLVWAAIVAFIALSMLWFFFKGPVLETLRWVRFGEMEFASLFKPAHYYDYCLGWLRNAKFNDPQPPDGNMIGYTQGCFGGDFLLSQPAKEQPSYYALTGLAMNRIETLVGYFIKWPLIVLFAVFGWYIIFISPRNKFRTKYNLESFIKLQAKMWPVINPIVDFNPIKSSARTQGARIPDRLPLFAEALSPEEWVSFHRIPVTNNIADREATRRAFLLQLGPRWNGIAGQPPYIQALFAAFALKGMQKRDESDALLGRIALGWSATGGFAPIAELRSEVDKIIGDAKLRDEALQIAADHAYRSTAMCAVLRWARLMGGVLAPAQFLWLRGVDRELWYTLNNLGRRSFHAEGAGAMAHFMAEQNAKKPLPIPRIETALVTLNQYLASAGVTIPPREGDPAPQGGHS